MINDSKNPHDSTDCYKVKQEFSLKKLEYRYHNITAILSSPRALKRYQESLYKVCVCGTQGLFDRKPQICRTIFLKCKQQTKSNFRKLRICRLRKCLWKYPSLLDIQCCNKALKHKLHNLLIEPKRDHTMCKPLRFHVELQASAHLRHRVDLELPSPGGCLDQHQVAQIQS